MGAKAVSPDDLANGIVHGLPDFVIEAFNRLITKNYAHGRAQFTQEDAIAEMRKGLNIRNEDIFKNGYLQVGPFFRAAGWSVEHDVPGYCEDYKAQFIFTKKRS